MFMALGEDKGEGRELWGEGKQVSNLVFYAQSTIAVI